MSNTRLNGGACPGKTYVPSPPGLQAKTSVKSTILTTYLCHGTRHSWGLALRSLNSNFGYQLISTGMYHPMSVFYARDLRKMIDERLSRRTEAMYWRSRTSRSWIQHSRISSSSGYTEWKS